MAGIKWRASSLVVVLLAGSGCGQPTSGEHWLQDNHVAIRSASPSDRDFSDLQFLKQTIGNRRVVQLGESAHGTVSVLVSVAPPISELNAPLKSRKVARSPRQ